MEQSNNRTIAKNTLMLYGRSVLMMLIGLYTSRVILHTLGITDFGVYNAVGGIVAMFGFISGSLGNATSRFITVAIGKGDPDLTRKTFGNVKVIYYLLSVLIVLLGETIGLWFLYHKMSIPADRMHAAFWVYQYSILATVIGFISIPYNSSIIAHERMSAFAYISLLDAVLKLLVCYLLLIVPYDKLIIYASLLFVIGVVDRIIYVIYCSKRFEEVHARPRIYREQFRSIMTMSGWTISGNLVWILNTQGVNIVLNMFFGAVVNAARGIALQVQGVMGQFVTNFQTAVNPQIAKSYAQGNYIRMGELLQMSSRFSYLLMFTMSLPVCIEAPVILRWWLGIVPDYTVIFLRLILFSAVITSLSNPLWISVLATGHLKKYIIWDNTVQFLVLPVTYAVFKWMGGGPAWAFAIIAISSCIGLCVRIWIVLPLIRYSYREYIQKVIWPLLCVTLLSPILPMLLYFLIPSQLINFMLVTLTSVACCGVTVWFWGMQDSEREVTRQKLYNRLAKWI
jgi:O-antigen/teichoic acid export membrane protein